MCSDRLRLTGRMTSYPPLFYFVYYRGQWEDSNSYTGPFVRLFKCYLLLYYAMLKIENKSMSMSMSTVITI